MVFYENGQPETQRKESSKALKHQQRVMYIVN